MRKLKSKQLLNNSYHLIIGVYWLILLASTKFINVKGKTFDKLKSKIEYRISKMS
jgi:hypothetical protein